MMKIFERVKRIYIVVKRIDKWYKLLIIDSSPPLCNLTVPSFMRLSGIYRRIAHIHMWDVGIEKHGNP
jgi:hypothetical protein